EPFRGISPIDAERLAAALRELARSGVAIVVTGHEAPTLLEAADHVTWCTDGTTYELGPPGEATRHERFGREYLGGWATGRRARVQGSG
ncbi:MAG TPA: ABC transporter ATP-binding protein, partial [Gemmatimonadaceae bacterium]|nr:ABC transporter ATP-binding protein [Gemmatimonadaceae bacterium]